MPSERAPLLIVIDASRTTANAARLVEATKSAMQRHDRLVVVGAPGVSPLAGPAARGVEMIDAAPGLLTRLAGEDTRPLIVIDGAASIVGRHWLDELTALLPTVAGHGAGAVAPRSNGAPWPQCPTDPPGPDASREQLRQVAARCAADGAEPFTTARLAGPCVALPADVARRLGDARPTVSAVADALAAAGVPVLVDTRRYVHATEGVPQLSVAMIMKDEEQELTECLRSLRPIADEIVIYDTGSTDGSVELARSLGAIVIEGEWRKDFAWARNEALAATRGAWVLSIDADERLEIDPGVVAELRGLLGDEPPVDRFIIDLFDLQGSVHAPVRSTNAVPMARLFRRRSCQWHGALHEQPDARPGRPAVRSVALPGLRFLHRGYLDEYVRGRNKWARNLQVAATGLDGIPDSDKECFDLGRSLRSVGDRARAFTLFERAADLAQNPVITRGALEFAALVLYETDQADKVGPYLERLRIMEGGAGPARYLQGWAHIKLGEWEAACDCFEGLTDFNDHFTGFRSESVSVALAVAYRGLGRRADAVAAAIEALRHNDQSFEAWAVLFDCCEDGSPEVLTAAALVDLDRLVPLFAKWQQTANAVTRDRLADALWQVHPGNRTVLAAASQFAAQLEPARQLVWSGRLRANGLAALCPLRTVADDGSRIVAERAAVLVRAVSDFAAEDLAEDLEKLVGLLHDHELSELLNEALRDHPGAAGSLIVAGATSAGRCVAIVAVLVRHGFLTEALAVLSHGHGLDPDGLRRLVAAQPELARTLRSAAEAAGRRDLDPVLPAAA